MPKLKKSARENELLEKARRYLPGGSLGNLAGDVVIAEGRGSRIKDVSGNEFIDYLLGSGPMITGHAHPDVVRAVSEQVRSGSTFFANNEAAILLAEAIVEAMGMRGSGSVLQHRYGGYAVRDAGRQSLPKPGQDPEVRGRLSWHE